MVVLEFNDIQTEVRGAMNHGKLILNEDNIAFKNFETNKTHSLPSSEIEVINWMKVTDRLGIRLISKNGDLNRYFGFKETDSDKITKYISANYGIDIAMKEFSVKGWNWGKAKFEGSVLSFEVNNLTAFEIALSSVSQCTTGKNEVTLEFHQSEDAPVSLMEMRFHIPATELAGDTDPVEAFKDRVMQQASVVSVSGDAVAIFREIQCLTPRGRYDFKIFSSFFQLHGKTFDYKVPMSTIEKLFLLPSKDGRQKFLVFHLDPPIKRGETRYHFLVFSFMQDEESNIELPFTEEEIAEKYDNKITKELSGATYEVVGKIMRVLVNRKITTPSGFKGASGTAAISCSYKAAAGYMYPLERGFIYVHKPPVHIRFEEIACVNFARSGGSTRSFDFEIELKSGVMHTFSSIEKEEYSNLSNFVLQKKLKVKNKGQMGKSTYVGDDDDAVGEGAPDAYLERVKREGKERDEDDEDDDDDDESTDEDFVPANTEDADEVAEEYDSQYSDSEEGSGSGSASEPKKKKVKKEKSKPKKHASSEKKEKKKKKAKDDGRPKRPPTAYMLWFNQARDSIKTDNPGISFTEIGKKGGEMWKTLNSTDKEKWEKKAAQAKEEYTKAMKEFLESGGGKKSNAESDTETSKKKPKKAPVISPYKSGTGSNYLSKEFIEEDDTTSSDSDGEPKAASAASAKSNKADEKSANKKQVSSLKEKLKKEESESEEAESGSESSSGSNASSEKKAPSSAAATSKRKKESDSEGEQKTKKKPKPGSDKSGSEEEESEEEESSASTTSSSDEDE